MNTSQDLRAGTYKWGQKIVHSWGSEFSIGASPRMVRAYCTRKGIKLDFSQVKDKAWSKWLQITKKYPDVLNVHLDKGTDLMPIIKWLQE